MIPALDKIRIIMGGIYSEFLRIICPIVVERWYNGFWSYRNKLISGRINNLGGSKTEQLIYRHYINRYGAFIGLNTEFSSIPILPHNLFGIFISESSKIGRNVTIYQHVTIGANQLKGSKNFGSPTIEDGVLIGAGAKIVGKVTIGRNSRIGAGCVVTHDVPPNSVVVLHRPMVITKIEELENDFIPYSGSILKV